MQDLLDNVALVALGTLQAVVVLVHSASVVLDKEELTHDLFPCVPLLAALHMEDLLMKSLGHNKHLQDEQLVLAAPLGNVKEALDMEGPSHA